MRKLNRLHMGVMLAAVMLAGVRSAPAQNAQILGAGLRAAARGMDDGDDPLAGLEVVGVDRKFDGLGRCRRHACQHNGGENNTHVQTI